MRPTAESAASRERPGIRMRRWLAPVTGGVAQLGERLLCKQEVIGSIPFTSTISLAAYGVYGVAATVARLRAAKASGPRTEVSLILHHAAIAASFGCHWRRFALTRVSAAIVEA